MVVEIIMKIQKARLVVENIMKIQKARLVVEIIMKIQKANSPKKKLDNPSCPLVHSTQDRWHTKR